MERIIKFSNQLEEVTRVASFIEELGEELHLSLSVVNAIQLAIEEAVVNVINYSYAPGQTAVSTLKVSTNGSELVFTLTDSGQPFNPLTKEEPDLTASVQERPVGGLGILLVKKLMDNVTYKYKEGNNNLILTKML